MNLSKMKIFTLSINVWTGRKKLRPEDIGISAGSTPPEVVSLGVKKTCPQERLRVFNTLRARAERTCQEHGLPFLGAYAIPNAKADELAAALEKLRDEFLDEKGRFVTDYNAIVEEWVQKHPRFEVALRKAITPVSIVSRRLGFRYGYFEVQADNLGGDAQEMADELGDTLLDEVVRTAQEIWTKKIDGADELSQRGLAPIRKLRDKVDSLAFLDSRAKQIVDAVDHVLGTLPKTGPVSNRDFVLLSLLVSQMMSKPNFNNLLETIKKGMGAAVVASAPSQDVGNWGWTGAGSKTPPHEHRRDADENAGDRPGALSPPEASVFW